MVDIGPVIIVVEALAILSSIAALVTKDNLYSALYLAVTSGLTALVFLLVNGILPFVLIVMIYIGATITVTIVLAATYRRPIVYAGVRGAWMGTAAAVIIIALLAIALRSIYTMTLQPPSLSASQLAHVVLSDGAVMLFMLLVSFLSLVMAVVIRYLKVTQG